MPQLIEFKVTKSEYNDATDMLTATVERCDADAFPETFDIIASFNVRIFSIRDTDPEGDTEIDYASRVLYEFLKAFKECYLELDHTASPADVFDEPFTFEFHC